MILVLLCALLCAVPTAAAEPSLASQVAAFMKLMKAQPLILDGAELVVSGEYRRGRERLREGLAIINAIEASGVSDPLNAIGPLRATTLSYIGAASLYLDDLPEAVRRLRESHQLLERLGPIEDQMTVSNQLGLALLRTGQHAEARESLREAADYFRRQGDAQELAMALANLCGLNETIGALAQAKSDCEEAVALLEGLGDQAQLASATAVLGDVLAQLGYREAALDAITSARRAIQRHGDGRIAAQVDATAAQALLRAGMPSHALPLLEQARRSAMAVQAPWLAAGVGESLSRLHRMQGDPEKAREAIETALGLAEHLADPELESALLAEFGAVELTSGNLAVAQTAYQSAERLARRTQLPLQQLNALNGLGAVAVADGRLDDATTRFEAVETLADEHGLVCQRCQSMGNLAEIYEAEGRWLEAVAARERQIARLVDSSFRNDELEARLELAELLHGLGMEEQARAQVQVVLATSESGDASRRVRAAVKLAAAELGLVSNAEAEAVVEEARGLFEAMGDQDGLIRSLQSLAMVRAAGDHPERTAAAFDAALEAAERGGSWQVRASLWVNVALQRHLGTDPAAALALCRRAGELIAGQDSPLRWSIAYCLARGSDRLGHTEEAQGHYLQAIELIEGQRRRIGRRDLERAFVTNKTAVYDNAIDLLERRHRNEPEQGFAATALHVLERRQARSFLRDIGRGSARRLAGAPQALIEELERIEAGLALVDARIDAQQRRPLPEQDRGELARLGERRSRLLDASSSLAARIQAHHPRLHALLHPEPLAPSAIQAMLRPGRDVAAVYLVADRATFIWVVTSSNIELVRVDSARDEIQAAVSAELDRLRLVLEPKRGATVVANGADDRSMPSLSEQLLPEALRDRIAGAGRLYIVPTGTLLRLPFETLFTTAADDPTGSRYLIEDIAVSYLGSLSQLRPLLAPELLPAVHPRPLLGLADPIPKRPSAKTSALKGIEVALNAPAGLADQDVQQSLDGLGALPNTRSEVEAIRDVLSPLPGQSLVLTGAQASRAALFDLSESGALRDFRYVVFATHGIVPTADSDLTEPALVLGPISPEGLLGVGDVYGLRLGADLVSLSACSTAAGELVPGEGTLGMIRAFQFAGGAAVSASLWSVNTYSAEALNRLLFGNLMQGMPPAQALRQAKLEMLDAQRSKSLIKLRERIPELAQLELSAPVYWAPVIVYGALRNDDEAAPGPERLGLPRALQGQAVH